MSFWEKLLDKIRRRKSLEIGSLLSPSFIILTIFFAIPFGICLLFSFGYFPSETSPPPPTLYFYQKAFELRNLAIFGRSLLLAIYTVGMCLLLGYPVSYCIALKSGRFRNALMALVIVPYWVNFLVRTYALITVLSDEGPVGTLFGGYLGIVGNPQDWIIGPGIMIAMVIDYLPFMILPLYASVEKLDVSLIEASKTLGASPFRTLIHVTIPLTKPGIAAGSLLSFIPAIAEFIVPFYFGGVSEYYIGNAIWDAFFSARNWHFGSAFSIIFIVLVLVGVMIYMRYVGEEISI